MCLGVSPQSFYCHFLSLSGYSYYSTALTVQLTGQTSGLLSLYRFVLTQDNDRRGTSLFCKDLTHVLSEAVSFYDVLVFTILYKQFLPYLYSFIIISI